MSEQILKDKRGVKFGKITTDSRGDSTVYDARNVRLGKISEDASGKLVAHDTRNVALAIYDPRANVTKHKSGHTLGKGNLLISIFFE